MLNRIKIDLDRTIGDLDRNVFGGFVEHLGRGVYGGIHDPASSQADASGLRTDVRAAIEGLGVSNIRYPGGNFASGYRWRDGVGPIEDRPTRVDLAWGALEPNTFGTNEFVRFCRTVGAEPYLVVNCGDGDLREARDWVEYCNGTADTALARQRAADGFPEPHRIRYWGIGNEVDGAWQLGAKSPAEYARTYHEFAKAMRWTDPSIRLIAAATSDWDGDVVERVQVSWSMKLRTSSTTCRSTGTSATPSPQQRPRLRLVVGVQQDLGQDARRRRRHLLRTLSARVDWRSLTETASPTFFSQARTTALVPSCSSGTRTSIIENPPAGRFRRGSPTEGSAHSISLG